MENAILFKLQKKKCFYCGCRMNGYTIDHFYPKSAGWGLANNKVLSCKGCNGKKGSRFPTEEEKERFKILYSSILSYY